MANLLEIAELAYNQIYPTPREKNAIALEEFIQTAKTEYAAAMWIFSKESEKLEGGFNIPSELMTEVELPVEDNSVDISGLKYLSALPNDMWLQGLTSSNSDCDCDFVKTTYSLSKTLCDDDSMPSTKVPYYIMGKSIKFKGSPRTDNVSLIYANMGTDVNEGVIIVNDYVASRVRDKLIQLYGKRVPSDITNNQNVNQ